LSDNARVDRRVRRTRDAVQTTLIRLMIEKDYSEITVQDIADRADVSRSTFYMHYADKDDVLRQGAVYVREWIASIAPRDRRFGFSEPLYQHCCDMRPVFRAITDRQSWAVMQTLFMQILGELIRDDLRDAADEPTLDAVVHVVSAAFLAVLTWAMDHERDDDAAEMDRLFRTFALPGVDALLAARTR
jgi:AcrR family transcriptional regulator